MSMMSKNTSPYPAHNGGTDSNCGRMSMKAPRAEDKNRKQDEDCMGRHRPCVPTSCKIPTQRPMSTSSMMTVSPRSNQQQWSDDFCVCGISPVIIEKKKKEVQPPQQGLSCLRLRKTSHTPLKRYSCPLIGSSVSSGQSFSSSSITTGPPVQTSVITGRDPLGWKLQPKSSFSSSRPRANRLSLQIPLPHIPVSNSPNRKSSPQTKPAVRPKPPRRHHSESSISVTSLAIALPVVTPEQIRALHLHHVSFPKEEEDVFVEEEEKGAKTPSQNTPPPVPEKSAMARCIALMITHSRGMKTRR